ncbi:helix-turn-helix transcriptional regulator [Comamonas guangdongensis]|uniref:Helix-turn-helix transcriptional regulator n=1 Tax=Comamonas guangdongensis TaxID=510515 RepID=A0ABV3ZYH1_9BURK
MTHSPIRTETIVTDDLVEARNLLQESFPGASVHPGPSGELQLDLQTDYMGGLVTHRLSTATGVKFRSPGKFDGYILAILDEGGLELEMGRKWREHAAPACIMVEAARVSRWRWRQGRYEIVLIDAVLMHSRLAQLLERPVAQRIQFESNVPYQAQGVGVAREIIKAARMCIPHDASQFHCAQEVLRSLQDAVMQLMLETIPHNYSIYMAHRHAGLAPKHVRRATDYIHANANLLISLEEIANVAHVSVRTLQAGFSRFKGLTPMAYLKQVRLEGVYADLRSANEQRSIAEIARHWRFGHLGQFAQDYRRAFGQSPSETRRTAKQAEH